MLRAAPERPLDAETEASAAQSGLDRAGVLQDGRPRRLPEVIPRARDYSSAVVRRPRQWSPLPTQQWRPPQRPQTRERLDQER